MMVTGTMTMRMSAECAALWSGIDMSRLEEHNTMTDDELVEYSRITCHPHNQEGRVITGQEADDLCSWILLHTPAIVMPYKLKKGAIGVVKTFIIGDKRYVVTLQPEPFELISILEFPHEDIK